MHFGGSNTGNEQKAQVVKVSDDKPTKTSATIQVSVCHSNKSHKKNYSEEESNEKEKLVAFLVDGAPESPSNSLFALSPSSSTSQSSGGLSDETPTMSAEPDKVPAGLEQATPQKKPEMFRAMKTPGPSIPTPMHPSGKGEGKSDDAEDDEGEKAVKFSLSPPPIPPSNAVTFDDAAFLPDDYIPVENDQNSDKENNNNTKTLQSPETKVFTVAEVQAKIAEALQTAQAQWNETTKRELEEEYKAEVSKLKRETEEEVEEIGNQWTSEHQSEIEEVKKSLREEFSRERQELVEKHEAELQARNNEGGAQSEGLTKELEGLKQKMKAREEEVNQEKTELSRRISQLEEETFQLHEEHARRLEDTEAGHKKAIENIMDESNSAIETETGKMEQMAASHAAELEKMTAAAETLAERLQLELSAEQHARQEDLRKAKEDTEKLVEAERNKVKEEFEQRLNSLSEVLSSEFEEMAALRSKLEETQELHAKELQESKDLLERTKRTFMEEKEEVVSRIQDEFNAEIQKIAGANQHSADGSAEAVKIVENLTEKIRKLEEEGSAFAATSENEKHELIVRHQQEMEDLKTAHEAERRKNEEDMEALRASTAGQRNREEVLEAKVVSLENTLAERQGEADRRVKEVRDSHASQIDEMLLQLDLVEAEHQERCKELESGLQQKEAIIAALGTQLAEATKRSRELDAERERHIKEIQTAQEQSQAAREAVLSLEETLGHQKKDHAKQMGEERKLRDLACDRVREEMIASAKEQFADANQHYMNLKHEYDSCFAKLTGLERESKAKRKELEKLRKEQDAREVEMTAELAQAKAGECNGMRG